MTPASDDPRPVEHGEVLLPGGQAGPVGGANTGPAPSGPGPDGDGDGAADVAEPAKVMRVGTMIKQLLEEVRATQLDEAGREGLRAIYDRSVAELSSALSTDLQEELARLAFPFSDEATPTEVELRMAQAQLVGWLEGLFHGIQATLFAQQMAARQQLERMRGQLPQGPGDAPEARPGTYL
jgi:hypothetical protein